MTVDICQNAIIAESDERRSDSIHSIKFKNLNAKQDVKVDEISHNLIGNSLINHVKTVNHDECLAGEEDSFFVCDLGEIKRSFQIWKQNLPQVTPHYAVKCNTNLEVIKLLASLGTGFDCASKNEIETILKLGINSNKIIYANPCKTNSFIRYARESNVNFTTVDNSEELYKLSKYHPECKILLRIITDDETSQCRLSTKFGCSIDEGKDLLLLAKKLGLSVTGVAFHVGSGAKDFTSIYKAIRDSRGIFDFGLNLGFEMNLLDIGGGFERETFKESSAVVRSSIDEFFPKQFVKENSIKFVAEPGRFMVSNAFTLGCHVIARRDLKEDGVKAMVYINDGVYGNLNCILFDHQHPKAFSLSHKGEYYYQEEIDNYSKGIEGKYKFSIWGPTCDGLDCVSAQASFSRDVEIGDWLFFPNLGAYTSAASTSFNGLGSRANTIYVDSEAVSY